MNPLFKFVLKLASSPRIDMQEDYIWIRKMQSFFSKDVSNKYRVLDEKIYSLEEEHEIPVRVFFPDKILHEETIIYIQGGGSALGDIGSYTRTRMYVGSQVGRSVYSMYYHFAV